MKTVRTWGDIDYVIQNRLDLFWNNQKIDFGWLMAMTVYEVNTTVIGQYKYYTPK